MYEVLEKEIENIQSEDYRDFVRYYLDEVCPRYFYEIGASASGKFHPVFAQGYGGLVRHTKAVVMMAKELLNMSSYAYLKDEYKDLIFVACILHDTCKYGMGDVVDKSEYMAHARNASYRVAEAWQEFFGEIAPPHLLMAIRSHMGQWSDPADDRPMTSLDRCVHMADYMASRPFIDIPELSAEAKLAVVKAVVANQVLMLTCSK